MLDYRMITFLTLCDQMNYRKTAEVLRMTQPAVTQHIHYLEDHYGHKLFDYTGRQLRRTQAGTLLEQYGRTAYYNDLQVQQSMTNPQRQPLRIGATKTIGDYVLGSAISNLVERGDYAVSLLVDNTHNLLHKLTHTQLDIALIEGYFDKQAYGYQLMRQERLVGICNKSHPLANQTVTFDDLKHQLLLLREKGSGTRAVFEQALNAHSYTLDAFENIAYISSFQVTKQLVLAGHGITFVYESIANSDPDLATFTTPIDPIVHDFHYVYLKNTQGAHLAQMVQDAV